MNHMGVTYTLKVFRNTQNNPHYINKWYAIEFTLNGKYHYIEGAGDISEAIRWARKAIEQALKGIPVEVG